MEAPGPFIPALEGARLDEAAGQLASQGIVRIEAALMPEVAGSLLSTLEDARDWFTVLRQGDASWYATQEECEAIGQPRLQAMAAVGVEQGFRYLYDVIRVSADPANRAERGLPVDRLADAWSSPEAIDLWRKVTGSDDITHIEIMATRYRPGHFLTRHNDGKDPARIAAFVLSLAPDWDVDWGGLLQFHGDDEGIERSLVPRFNTLAIFTVPRPHSVSLVAPFARSPRYSITGWFRDRPAVDE